MVTSTALSHTNTRRGSTSKPSAKQRSRQGCRTCKQKHVKCDEARPACRQCAQKGLTCGGYARDFTWSYKHQPWARQIVLESTPSDPSPDNNTSDEATASVFTETEDTTSTLGTEFPNTEMSFDNFDLGDQLDYAVILDPWQPTQSQDLTDVSTSSWPTPWTQSSDLDGMTFPGSGATPRLPVQIRGGPQAVEALMTNWFDQVCPAWSAYDSSLNPNRKIALELMHSSAAVFTTLQSMSASFLSVRLPQLEKPALQMLRTAAVSVMTEANAARSQPVLDKIPTGLLFSLFCLGTSVCWLDASRLGLPFLKEAKDLLSRLSSNAVTASHDQLEMLAFFKKSLLYWEMLLSFVDDYEPDRAEQDSEVAPNCMQVTKADQFPHPWTGISTQTSRLFTQSIRLCRSCRRRVSRHSASEIAIEAAMQEIGEAQNLEQRLLELDFSSVTPTNTTGDEKTPWMHLAYVAEAYQLAALLQLYLTFPGLVALRLQLDSVEETAIPCDRWTIPLALRLTKLLEQIPPESGSRVIQPLLYICASTGLCYNVSPLYPTTTEPDITCDTLPVTLGGSGILSYIDQMQAAKGSDGGDTAVSEMAVEVASARSFILRRLDTLECTLQPRPIMIAKQLVKAIWAVYDDETRGCMSGHWLDVMESQNLRSLFG